MSSVKYRDRGKMFPKQGELMKYNYLGEISLLYVEDDENIREGFVQILKRFVSNIIIAEDGKDGLEKYLLYKPDVIITDIQMPKMNGLNMIEQIRQNNKDVQIIITTAFNDIQYTLSAIKLGVDGFFLKPVENVRKYLEILEQKAKYALIHKENIKKDKIINSILDKFFDIAFFVEDKKIVTINQKASLLMKDKDIFYFLNTITPQLELKETEKEIIKFENHFYSIKIEKIEEGSFIITLQQLDLSN